MKKHYRKIARWNATEPGDFYYCTHNYHRPIRTVAEIRANLGLIADGRTDDDLRGLHIFPRGARGSYELDSWNDFAISRNWKKSWKDFTKNRKQWMMGDEPPIDPNGW